LYWALTEKEANGTVWNTVADLRAGQKGTKRKMSPSISGVQQGPVPGGIWELKELYRVPTKCQPLSTAGIQCRRFQNCLLVTEAD
jgi:hypothetical protein